jgi:uncharacterized protein YndB with AHSA1/START domain
MGVMTDARTTVARVASYELEISVNAPPERVWKAITDETNDWWLPDFHMVGAGSVMTFDAQAGGGLVEELEGGGSLLWYTVLWIQPDDFTLYLVGHSAPKWGGPNTSTLQLTVQPNGKNACALRVSDARYGHIDEENIKSLEEGWKWLFTDGLKHFVEAGSI